MNSPTLQISLACQRAVELHTRGQLGQAQTAYEDILRTEPNHFVALHHSGLIAAQTGNAKKAVDLIERAIAILPGVPSAHCNLALALHQSGDLESALVSVTRALTLSPAYVVAYLNRASIRIDLGQLQGALADYDQAIAIDQNLASAHYGRGCLLHTLKSFDAALSSLHRAIALDSQYAAAHFRCGNVLGESGDWAAALRSYALAEAAGMRSAALYLARGVVLVRLKDFDAALASFAHAIGADRHCYEAHYNLGVLLAGSGDLAVALESYARAVAINPNFYQAYLNQGVVLAELARPIEARDSFERVILLEPHCAEAHFDLALVLLKLGQFPRGWQEYEWRWKNTNGVIYRGKRNFPQPLWLGDQDLIGRTILLHAEQGFGDTLQFCRYAPLVAELGATVILEVPAALQRLLESLPGPLKVVAQGKPLPTFDLQCPLMSLPLAFGTTLESVPARAPYLKADVVKQKEWEEMLGVRSKFRVGLVWAGRPPTGDIRMRPSFNGRRDLPMDALAQLALPEVQYYSLQTGEAAAQFAQLSAAFGQGALVNCAPHLIDFSDTAALAVNLDLVVTVDTATAHLAGALGMPVWIINRLDSCWRWLVDRSDSPWYPTATVHRQTDKSSWHDLLARLRVDLEALVARHKSAEQVRW